MKSIKVWGFLLIGVVAILIFGILRVNSASRLSLVKDGVPTATIVMGKNLPKVENYAVRELQTYLKKISGVQIPIRDDSEEVPGCKILVGTLESNPLLKSLREQLTGVDSLGKEGFLIKTLDNNLVIAGGGSGGVLYGVYTFLEKYLGCRWFFPGEEGEVVPKQKSINLGKIADIQKPSFKYRGLFISDVGAQYSQSIIDWMARNKMNVKKTHHHVIGLNKWYLLSTNQPPETQYEGVISRAIKPDTTLHSFWWLVPADAYYDKHPEYYSLINGKRVRPEGGGVNVQLCLSNPEVQKIVVEKTRNFFAEYPKVEIMGVTPNDGVGFCECENCKAFGKSQTDRLVNFVNIVAKEIYKTNPDKYIGFMAYSDCTPPPSVKPLENVMVEYVRNGRCYKHSFDDPECKENAVRRAEIKGWLEKVKPDHFLWGDFDDCQNDLPEPTAGTVTKDLKLFSELGMAGFVQAVTPASWDVLKLHRYVLAKTAWDKNLKYEDILDDFCRKYYGPAGEPMKKYYQALDEAVEGAPGCFLRREIIDVLEKALTPTILRKLKGYLIEAQMLAEKNKDFSTRVSPQEGSRYKTLVRTTQGGKTDVDEEPSTNLVSNPGFEEGEADWKTEMQSGEYILSIDETEAHEGKKSAKIVGAKKGRARWYRAPYIPVEKGKKYYFSAWAKAEENSDFYFLLAQGSSPSQSKWMEFPGNKEAKWKKYVIPEITTVDNNLGIFLMNDGTGAVWFDDIILRKIGD